MIYSFGIWRVELNRISSDLSSSLEQLDKLDDLQSKDSGLTTQAAFGTLYHRAYEIVLKSFLLSSLVIRKMDDAAKHPFPAGKMSATRVDREVPKRLHKYAFDGAVGTQTNESEIRVQGTKSFNGRKLTNLAIHSEEMRLFSPPCAQKSGFWVRSDREPDRNDGKKFWFLDLEEYQALLDDFRLDPWKE